MRYSRCKRFKQKYRKVNGHRNCRIGTVTSFLDKKNNLIKIGDRIDYCNGYYKGIFLYDYTVGLYGIALEHSMWYGDDKYDINSYGKFIEIREDNGGRMKLEIIH